MKKVKSVKNVSKEVVKNTRKEAKKTLAEYKKFALKGNILDLAIGVVIGSAFTNIVNAIVNTAITPLISLLTNRVDLSTLYINLSGTEYENLAKAKEAGALVIEYGTLLNAFLNFFIISFVLFLIVKYSNKLRDKMDTTEKKEQEEITKNCPYCLNSIPKKATRCGFCTSILEENIKKEKK